MANFMKGFVQGFSQQTPTNDFISKVLYKRMEKAQEEDRAAKLGKAVKDLNIKGADKIGEALENKALTPSEAISLANVLQKGTPSALELGMAKAIGLDLSDLDVSDTADLSGSSTTLETPKELTESGRLKLKSFSAGGAKFEAEPTEAELSREMDKIRRQKQTEATIETSKQVTSQAQKAQEKLGRDFLRVDSVIDTTVDAVFNFNEQQLKNFGTKPGAFLGIVDALTPKQWNEYKAATEAAGREASATVGRYLIPGARGANLTTIFAKSSAEIGNTISGNANNVAYTMSNTLANALTNNAIIEDENGKMINLQDITVDRKTGKMLSQLPIKERARAINDLKSDHREMVSKHYIAQAYLREPNLLTTAERAKLIKQAPEFSSLEEVDSAVASGNMMPGTLFRVNGKIGVAR